MLVTSAWSVSPAHTLCLRTPQLADTALLRREGGGRAGLQGGLDAARHSSPGPFSPGHQVRLEEESAQSARRKNGRVGEVPPKVALLSCGSGSIFTGEHLRPPPHLEDTS